MPPTGIIATTITHMSSATAKHHSHAHYIKTTLAQVACPTDITLYLPWTYVPAITKKTVFLLIRPPWSAVCSATCPIGHTKHMKKTTHEQNPKHVLATLTMCQHGWMSTLAPTIASWTQTVLSNLGPMWTRTRQSSVATFS